MISIDINILGKQSSHTSSAISFLMRMFLALKKSSRDFCSSLFMLEYSREKKQQKTSGYLPVDVAKLVLTQATL